MPKPSSLVLPVASILTAVTSARWSAALGPVSNRTVAPIGARDQLLSALGWMVFSAHDVAHQEVAVGIGTLEDDLVGADAGEAAAAAGAVVVGGDDELLRRIDRLAVEHQVDDAAIGVADVLALGAVFGGLGDIDLVGDAVDDVEIVGRGNRD